MSDISRNAIETMTLHFFERFQKNLQQLPDQVALQSITAAGRESFTYRRIGEEAGKISLFLQRAGVRPQTPVGILMDNHPRWGIAFLAAYSAGAVVVPLDTLLQAQTLADLVQRTGCEFLISSEKFSPQLNEIRALLSKPLPALISGTGPEDCAHWDTVLQQTGDGVALPLVSRGLDEDFLVIYTGGTTGNPKGVVLTQRNIFRNVVELLAVIGASHRDHFLSVLPLHHILTLLVNLIVPLYLGARVTYLEALEPQRILSAFQQEGVTIFVCVPQFFYLLHRRIFQQVETQAFFKKLLFRSLLRVSHFSNEHAGWNPGRFFFSSIHKNFGPQFRLFAVGGARFAPEIAQAIRDLGFDIAQSYGMTESAGPATVTSPGPRGAGSVGRPLRHVEVRVDEPDPDGIGEVLIRGESIMKGYWEDAEATADVLRDGWLHSGDLGCFSPEGFLYITGRKKEVIVLSSGKNIFPEELEHFYQANCPFIKEMCIVGAPDPASLQHEETLHAIIVPDFDYLRTKKVVNAYEMIRYHVENISQRLPPYDRVRSFEIRTEPLPRTTTRKLKRFQIQKEMAANLEGKAKPQFAKESQPESPVEQQVFEMIRQIRNVPVINREMNLELDLGFGSLERVELLFNVRQAFEVEISDEAATEIFTVRDLAAAVESRLSGRAREPREAIASWSEILKEPLQPEEKGRVQQTLKRRPVVELILYVIVKILHLLGKLLFRLQFRGTEYLPRDCPFMICPNHLSLLDGFLVVSGLPYRVARRLFFLGDSDYFSSPIMSWVAQLIKVIPADPDRHVRKALRLGVEGLRKGLVLCVFPEGGLAIDGALKPFQSGPAILATELQVPVVPVGIVGTYEVWARASRRIRLHPVRISLDRPLLPNHGESFASFNNRLFDAVRQLLLEREVH